MYVKKGSELPKVYKDSSVRPKASYSTLKSSQSVLPLSIPRDDLFVRYEDRVRATAEVAVLTPRRLAVLRRAAGDGVLAHPSLNLEEPRAQARARRKGGGHF